MNFRRAHRTWVPVAVTCVAVMLAVTACSGSGHHSTPPTPPPTTATSGPTSSPTSTAQAGSQPVGALINQNLYDASQPYLPALSGGNTFYEAVWCNIEKSPGNFNWRQADQYVRSAAQAGLATFIKIRTGRCWATGGATQFARGVGKTESAMPQSTAQYQAFVTAVVKRYQPMGVTEYAVENETNSPSFWDGSPSQYDQLVKAAASAIHASDPSALVVDSAVSSVAAGYGVVHSLLTHGQPQQALQYYNAYYSRRFGTRGAQITRAANVNELRTTMGSSAVVRDLAFLAEANSLVAHHVVQVRQVHFYEPPGVLAQLLAYLRTQTPKNIPLQMWELGSYMRNSPLTPQQRSAELVESTAITLSAGVTKVLWLPLIATANGRITANQLFALLSPTGAPTPAASAYAAMAAASSSATVVAINAGGLQGVGFDHDRKSTVFVWSSAPRPVTVSSGAKVSALGGVAAPQLSGGSLTVGPAPVELTLPESVSAFVKALN